MKMDTGCTYPQILLRNYQEFGSAKVCMRKKKFGIWNEYTWKDYYEQVRNLCLGLISLGLRRKEKVCVLGDNNPQWFWSVFAAQAAGAVAVGIYADSLPSEMKYYMEQSDSNFAIVEDQEQVDKLLEIKNELPLLRRVVYWNPDGMDKYDDPILMPYQDLLREGKEHAESEPGLFEKVVGEGKSEDIGNLFFTSGTTGLPKAAMFSYGALSHIYNNAFSPVFTAERCKDFVSVLPAAGLLEYVQSLGAHLSDGMIINFPEKVETAEVDLREIGPDFVFLGSRQWKGIFIQIAARISDARFLGRFAWAKASRVGLKMMEFRSAGIKPGLLWRVLYGLADRAIFKRVKDNIGLRKAKVAFTAGTIMNQDILRAFNAIGVNLREFYAGTEFGIVGFHQLNEPYEIRATVLPSGEVKISDEGEILIRSDGLFSGYYKEPKSTEEHMKDGWFHTGDAGGSNAREHLILYDRLSDLGELSSRVRYAPQSIESRLGGSPYISYCLVLGGKERDYLSTIITMDVENVGKWAVEHGLRYTNFADLSQKDEVAALILEDVKRLNGTLPEASHLKKFVLLHKEFDPDEGELTRTKKLRRAFIEEKYAPIIDGIYGDKDVVVVVGGCASDGNGKKVAEENSIKIRRIP